MMNTSNQRQKDHYRNYTNIRENYTLLKGDHEVWKEKLKNEFNCNLKSICTHDLRVSGGIVGYKTSLLSARDYVTTFVIMVYTMCSRFIACYQEFLFSIST